MSKELLTEFGHKKEVYKRWKQGQGDPGELQGHSKLAGMELEKPKQPTVESGEGTWKAKRAST